jgi:hypothetical protein
MTTAQGFDWNTAEADVWVPRQPRKFVPCRVTHTNCSPQHRALMEAWEAAKAQNEAEIEEIAIGYATDRKLAIERGLVTVLTFRNFISHI